MVDESSVRCWWQKFYEGGTYFHYEEKSVGLVSLPMTLSSQLINSPKNTDV